MRDAVGNPMVERWLQQGFFWEGKQTQDFGHSGRRAGLEGSRRSGRKDVTALVKKVYNCRKS